MKRRSFVGVSWVTVLGTAVVSATTAAAEPVVTKSQPAASVYSTHAPDGETYFALALRTAALPAAKKTSGHHAVLVDTSASQIGEHRRQAFAVLKGFLQSLPAEDRVAIYAVDVKTHALTKGFVPATGELMTAALTKLNQRVPLGATKLHAAVSTAADAVDGKQHGSILYIGDGLSVADTISSQELSQLLRDLRSKRIAVHSYAVGPRTDLQLLGIMAQQTGGAALFDRADDTDTSVIGRELARAVNVTVFYPTEIHGPANAALLPKTALPMRSDRDTIYLGKGTLAGEFTVSVTGNRDGRDLSFRWNISKKDFRSSHAVVGALWKRAAADDGLSVGLAGVELLNVAQKDFDNYVGRLVALGEQAISIRSLKQAEEIGLAVRSVDPANVRAKAILGAANRLQVRRIALATHQDAQPKSPDLEKRVQQPEQVDLPAQEAQRQRIIAERLTLEVSRRIEGARSLADTDPDAALSFLKEALGTVQSTIDIDPGIRQKLIKRLQGEIQDVTNKKEVINNRIIQDQERLSKLESEKRLIEVLLLEEEELNQLINRVRSLLREGVHGNDDAYEEAESVARAALEKRPFSGIASAALFVSEAAGQLNKAFRLKTLGADRWLEALHQVELSHIPFPDEPPIRWPAAEVWQALTERRKKWASVDLHSDSPNERRIQEQLQSTTEVEFLDTPMRDAIEYIADLHGITIIIDDTAFEEEGIETDEVINRVLSGISLRSALKIILEPLGLTYVIENEVMVITTEIVAEEKLSTRVYPVGDLVIPIQTPQGGGIGQGGGGGGGQGFGGGGGGQGGVGGQGGGGGFFSVPPTQRPARPAGRAGKTARRKKSADLEIREILEDILGAVTNQPRQAFAQVNDPAPRKNARFDNDAVRSLKKKRAATP